MATSGTVGQTVISTAKVLEHALRRCQIPTSNQTPETVLIAEECLYLLLMHYANTSFNLWCVDKVFIGYQDGRKDYPLPTGSNDVLNVLHCTPQLATKTTLIVNVQTLDQFYRVVRVGVKFSVLPLVDFIISTSADGVTYTDRKSARVTDLSDSSLTYWYEFDPAVNCKYVQVSSGTVSSMLVATSTTDIPVSQLNRDMYSGLPNKDMPSSTVTNYLFGKTLDPFLTLWPVPNDETRHLMLWVHRNIQDVGRLTQVLAIPQRWFESTIIQLAFRLSLELPGVPDARIQLLSGLAAKFQIEASGEETDSAPIFLQPRIGSYTK